MTTGKSKIKYGSENLKKDNGPMTFAKLLHAYRISEGLSQVELAKKINLSKGNICDFEKGRKIPSPLTAAKMAQALGDLPAYWIEVVLQDQLSADELNYSVKILPKKASGF
jgi:transcriptional regulator with XRE-family HTH domain